MTLWLTRIRLNLRRADVRRDLADAVRMHRRVMSLVPDDLGATPRAEAKALYRIDRGSEWIDVLAQTGYPPQTDRLPSGYGDVQTRDLMPLLDRLDKDDMIAYRLTGNTAKRIGRTGVGAGKIRALDVNEVDDWWRRHATRAGLEVDQFRSHQEPTARGRTDGGSRLLHAVTRFDGVATITDPDTLRAAISFGIGRAKAYGCGLLSVRRLA